MLLVPALGLTVLTFLVSYIWDYWRTTLPKKKDSEVIDSTDGRDISALEPRVPPPPELAVSILQRMLRDQGNDSTGASDADSTDTPELSEDVKRLLEQVQRQRQSQATVGDEPKAEGETT